MFDPCPTCEGSGEVMGDRAGGMYPCSRCVGGRVVSESVIEKAANAIYALDWGNHPPHLNAVTWNKAQERARAAARVVLEHMEDNE